MRPAAEPQVQSFQRCWSRCVGEDEAVRGVKRNQRPGDKRFGGWLAVFALLTQDRRFQPSPFDAGWAGAGCELSALCRFVRRQRHDLQCIQRYRFRAEAGKATVSQPDCTAVPSLLDPAAARRLFAARRGLRASSAAREPDYAASAAEFRRRAGDDIRRPTPRPTLDDLTNSADCSSSKPQRADPCGRGRRWPVRCTLG